VSAEHNEAGSFPYYWFAFHQSQREFLQQAQTPWICLGCGSADTTLLFQLSEIQEPLTSMSVTKTEERFYWHVVVQRKAGRLILRLLAGMDGPDLTGFNIGKTALSAKVG
jgi:hypothetical protein